MLAQVSGTPANTVQVPTTRAELDLMHLRRSELTDQLQSLSQSRQQLVGERYSATVNQNPTVVAELDGRIKEISARAIRIEREKLTTDDAISVALSRGVVSSDLPAIADVPPPEIPRIPSVPWSYNVNVGALREDFRDMMMIEAASFILVGFVMWRWMKYRFTRQLAARQVSGETPAAKELKDAVYAMAVEIERISENQRFVTKLLSEKPQAERALVERDRSEGR